ncbi:MAG: hypothetical protein E7598_07815 [Ruminococcaceae bacterium]|nr:hypothetical protein [Oscillospiraceae bacterium]
MKKLIAILFALSFMLGTLLGCSFAEKLGIAKEEQPGYEMHEVHLEEHAVYDKDGIEVIVKSLDYSEKSYIIVNFEVHNHTETDIRVCTDYFEANGIYLARHAFEDEYCICPAGEITTDRIKIARSKLNTAHISHIKELDFSLCIENGHFEADEEDHLGHDHGDAEMGMHFVVDGVVAEATNEIIVPTDCDADYIQGIDEHGTVLVNEQGIYLVLQDLYISDGGYTTIASYFKNDSTDMARATVYLHKVNGMDYENDGRLSMLNGHDGFPSASLFGLLKNELGVTKIDSATVSVEVYLGDGDDALLIFKGEPMELEF